MSYTSLLVWQKSDELAYQVYLITQMFPRDERFSLISQLRRSALSVATNLAEGTGRQNRNETKQFANIALGSLAEVDYLLRFSARLGYISQENYSKLKALKDEVGALLWLYHKSF